MEPFTLGLVVGAVYAAARAVRGTTQEEKDRKLDKRLPSGWELDLDIETMARQVAEKQNRAMEHVLVDYGVYIRANGLRYARKALTRDEALKVIKRMRKDHNVLTPREEWQARRVERQETFEDEEPF